MEWRYRRTQGSSGGDYIVGEGSGEEGSKTKKKKSMYEDYVRKTITLYANFNQ